MPPPPPLEASFARRALSRLPGLIAADPLVQQFVTTFAQLMGRMERDLIDVLRSHALELADPRVAAPFDLVRISALAGLGEADGFPTELFRRRLRLFVQAFLLGAGTPRALLTMGAAELGAETVGQPRRDGGTWVQAVRRVGLPPGEVRLEESPPQRRGTPAVAVKTGSRWSYDNPSADGVLPQVTIEALARVHGPSLILEDAGLAWLLPGVVLNRGDRVVLGLDPTGRLSATRQRSGRWEDVSERIDVVGDVASLADLETGLTLAGGSPQPASLLVSDPERRRLVRFRARTPGAQGNGFRLRRESGPAGPFLTLSFDPLLAARGTPSPDEAATTRWTLPPSPDGDLLRTAVEQLPPGAFLIEAEYFSVFLPLGRSHWAYLDHTAVPTESGGSRDLARLVLNYTRFGAAAYHEVDSFEVFRFDDEQARFGRAAYTAQEEVVRVSFSWREARPAALRLEAPPWAETQGDATGRRLIERFAAGLGRIKAGGVAAAIRRALPGEVLRLGDGLSGEARLVQLGRVRDRPRAETQLDSTGMGADRPLLSRALPAEAGAVRDSPAGRELRRADRLSSALRAHLDETLAEAATLSVTSRGARTRTRTRGFQDTLTASAELPAVESGLDSRVTASALHTAAITRRSVTLHSRLEVGAAPAADAVLPEEIAGEAALADVQDSSQ